MDLRSLDAAVSPFWLWAVVPLFIATAIVLSFRLRVPQLMRLGAAFGALRARDPEANGDSSPAGATVLAIAGMHGAIGAVAAATAVSLGGAGAIVWVWIFALLAAPLRMTEAILARTAPPGRAGVKTGSLGARLLADPQPSVRVLGWVILALLPLGACLYFAGASGLAIRDVSAQIGLGSATAPMWVAAAIGAAIPLLPMRKTASFLGWFAIVALFALIAAIAIALTSEMGRSFMAVGRAFSDALEGSANAGAFSGALAGEIASAALMHMLLPLVATSGVEGALHADAQAKTTKGQATAALLSPLAYAALTSLLGIALVSTGAFSRRVEDSRPLREVRVYRSGFETASQRLEPDRFYEHALRIVDGELRAQSLELATDRGMIESPRFDDGDRPADVALRVRRGEAFLLQKPDQMGALQTRPDEEMDRLTVRGTMLPRGAHLVKEAMQSGGGLIVAQLTSIALLFLAALGIGAWGIAIVRTTSARLPQSGARAAGLLPALGVAVAALGVGPSLSAIGTFAAGALGIVVMLALLARGSEAARLAS